MRKLASRFTKALPKSWHDSRGITGLETAIVLIAFVVVSSVFAFAALSTGLFSSDKSKETIRAGLTEASGTLEVRGSIYATGLTTADEVAATHTADGAITVLSALDFLPVVDKSDTVTLKPANTTLTRVSSGPTGTQYSINNDTGVITLGTALTTGDSIEADYTAGMIDQITVQVANAAGGDAVDLTSGETLVTYLDADQSVNIATGDVTVTALGNADTDKLVEPGEMYEIKLTGLVAALATDLKKDKAFTLSIKPAVGAVIRLARTTPVLLDISNDLG